MAFNELQKCAKEHDCCEKGATLLPTRVIKVGRGPEDVRLQKGGFCARYICLSHCWGSKQPLITTKQNVDDHFVRIVWENMPLLYQDTVRLAWQSGIEYIWIDSLCIIQDSSDDWAHEAGSMKDVYGNSWLTIAATSNPDCCSGILDNPCDQEGHARFASFKDSIQYSGVTRPNQGFSWLAFPGDINACELHKHTNGNCRWPLLTRGWVLQERVLSPRVVYFTAASMLWCCKEGDQHEESAFGRLPKPHPKTMDITASKSRDADPSVDKTFWLDIIEDYCNLKLTDHEDRLPALSGLAQKFSQQMPSGARYLAGVWSSSLLQGLSWYNNYRGGHGRRRNPPCGVLTGCSRQLDQPHQGAPSWSWASIEGSVKFPKLVRREAATTFHVQIIDTDCTPVSHHDPTGQVSNGRIHLRGPISRFTPSDHLLIKHPKSFRGRVYFDCPVHTHSDDLMRNQIMCLVLLTKKQEGPDFADTTLGKRNHNHYSVGLLLRPVVGKDFEYRRVALVHSFYNPDASLDSSAWFERLSNVEDVIII